MKALTARQQEIYDFLVKHLSHYGYPPTLREICAAFEMKSTRAASDHLVALERKGYISRKPDMSRGIELMGPRAGGQGESIPVLGEIAAGPPLLAQENISDRLTLDAEFLSGDGNFLLEVKGQSMIEAHICPGDLVLVRPQDTANNGDIVVALLEGEEATVKRFQKSASGIKLIPENKEMQPITVDDLEQFRVVGKVVGVIRKL